jgi:hypothetical protein
MKEHTAWRKRQEAEMKKLLKQQQKLARRIDKALEVDHGKFSEHAENLPWPSASPPQTART